MPYAVKIFGQEKVLGQISLLKFTAVQGTKITLKHYFEIPLSFSFYSSFLQGGLKDFFLFYFDKIVKVNTTFCADIFYFSISTRPEV